MKRIMLFRISSRDVQLPRLIGAFVLFAAVLMFVRAGAQMFDSWDAAKDTQKCFAVVGGNPEDESVSECKEMANELGLYVKSTQAGLTTRQFWSVLLLPIANLFFWAAAFLVGLVLYGVGNIVVPIEQTIKDVPEQKPVVKK